MQCKGFLFDLVRGPPEVETESLGLFAARIAIVSPSPIAEEKESMFPRKQSHMFRTFSLERLQFNLNKQFEIMAATRKTTSEPEYLNDYKPTKKELDRYEQLVRGYSKCRAKANRSKMSDEEFLSLPAVKKYLNYDKQVQNSFPAFLLFHKATRTTEQYIQFLEREANLLYYWDIDHGVDSVTKQEGKPISFQESSCTTNMRDWYP